MRLSVPIGLMTIFVAGTGCREALPLISILAGVGFAGWLLSTRLRERKAR